MEEIEFENHFSKLNIISFSLDDEIGIRLTQDNETNYMTLSKSDAHKLAEWLIKECE